MEVPENILEKTQQIATAKGISPQAHVDIIAAVISASGGNIDDFRLSRTTGYRSREKVEKVVADNVKSEFRKICQDRSRKLIVHFDGKLTEELAPMKIHKEKKDRCCSGHRLGRRRTASWCTRAKFRIRYEMKNVDKNRYIG